uniref:Low density lipoprotein receptor adapter protein 1 n=1 Tax=Cacopsylla melanoneura TaxID=428564 RepID=A0A8D8V072_9HEMI
MNVLKTIFSRSPQRVGRHEKLETRNLCSEEEEAEFQVHFLGDAPIAESNSKKSTAKAVENMVKMSKQDRSKTKKVTLVISPAGIRINETSSYCLVDVPLTHISYCSADAKCTQMFAFVSINARGDLKCYVFDCQSKKYAREIATTFNKIFQAVYLNMKVDARQQLYPELSRLL